PRARDQLLRSIPAPTGGWSQRIEPPPIPERFTQLARLLRTPVSPRYILQVLPFSHGGHALAGGALALWTLPRGEMVAYEEAMIKGTLVDEKDEVEYRSRHYDLLAASALPPRDSADMIRSAMEDLPHEHHS
ncbi:Scr1 family TA system antitoxin-like transcriptional regulator, partial [Streptomyces albidoflavus]